MSIKRIYDDSDSYEVGEDDISNIELTAHGNKKMTIYKVTYTDNSILFVGFLEHEVEHRNHGIKEREVLQIKFKELTLQNFKSHQDLKVEFGDTTQITGDNARGKSSIGESIIWLLYGTDMLGSKLDPSPDTYEADSTKVELLFEVDGKQTFLGREIAKGRNKFYVNEVPSKATEFNQVIEQLFDKELFLSLFNPSYFFTLHWEKQRGMILQYATAPANKEVFKELPKPQSDKLSELVKKQSLDDLVKIHRDNKNKKEKEHIAAQSRTKTLKEQLDQFGSLVPVSSLNTEKAQIEKSIKEYEDSIKDSVETNQRINFLNNKIDSLTVQIDQGRDNHTQLKAREINVNCHACGQELKEDSKQTLVDNKESELSKIAEQVNPLIKERKSLREELSSLEYIEMDEKQQEKKNQWNDKLFNIEHEMNRHKQLEKLNKDAKESAENEKTVKESLNDSIFILDAIKAFNAKEAELQAEKVQGLFENLAIRLFDTVKTTGELKPTFVIQMDGKDYIKLSTAEKIKAGLELRDVLSEQSDLITPCFVDNAESITKFKEPNGQLIMAKVEAGKELEVVTGE